MNDAELTERGNKVLTKVLDHILVFTELVDCDDSAISITHDYGIGVVTVEMLVMGLHHNRRQGYQSVYHMTDELIYDQDGPKLTWWVLCKLMGRARSEFDDFDRTVIYPEMYPWYCFLAWAKEFIEWTEKGQPQ